MVLGQPAGLAPEVGRVANPLLSPSSEEALTEGVFRAGVEDLAPQLIPGTHNGLVVPDTRKKITWALYTGQNAVEHR